MSRYLDDPTALWAEAKISYLAGDFPAYGSSQWRDLPPESPQRLAAVLEAAELWRRHVAEQARLDDLLETDPGLWWQEATQDADEEARRTLRRLRLSSFLDARERAELRRPLPPHQLRVTPGWPPVAIPGRPGWWRHCRDGRQIDLPYRDTAPKEAAA
ncbi:hypothetical protein [Streptomyces sp. x-80]|uniref:hypothetical protein n=1 Tax=Streptomyces sp. x-80 TaxID=2789282 RepID=UPI00397F2457